MVKKLKFAPELIPLILSEEKYSTWRLWDDKDLKTGDQLNLTNATTLEVFAKAEITRVTEKSFCDLTREDKQGHEKFKNNEEALTTYSKYYHRPVNSKTKVKIILFRLIK